MPGRKRSDRGAVAVEAALVTPILMLLVFGIIEMSLLMRDAAGVNNQVRAGARIAATEAGAGLSSANNPALAVDATTAIQNAGSSMPLDSVNWVLVYQANQYGYPLPTSNQSSLDLHDELHQVRLEQRRRTRSCVTAAPGTPPRSTRASTTPTASRWEWPCRPGTPGSPACSAPVSNVPARLMMQFEPLPATTCAAGKHS